MSMTLKAWADRVGDRGIVGAILSEVDVVEIRDSSTGR
jgi:hypothetical protein